MHCHVHVHCSQQLSQRNIRESASDKLYEFNKQYWKTQRE